MPASSAGRAGAAFMTTARAPPGRRRRPRPRRPGRRKLPSSARQPRPRHLAERLGHSGVLYPLPNRATAASPEIGDAVLYVTDGRSATQRAAESGVANTVLIDLALDYAKATRLAVAAAEQCAPAAAAAAIGLLQAAGFAVSRFADVPGLAVMRTVAMLANEAGRRGQPGRVHRRRRRFGDAPRRQLPAGAAGLGGPGRRRGDPRRPRQPRRQPMARIATASRR